MRPAAIAAVCVLLAFCAPAEGKRRSQAPQLLRLITPAGKATVPAHPDVNIVVRFVGNAAPETFRARLSGRDISERFVPLVEAGKTVGVRATVPRDRIRLGRRRANRLRVLVKARDDGAKGRTPRQIVRARFRAVEAANQPPVAIIEPDSEIVFPNVPLRFDGGASFDPEADELSYTWSFTGGAANGASTSITFNDQQAGTPQTVMLTVSDGQASSSTPLALRTCPQPDGIAPGVIQVGADTALEFGAVAPGASASRTFDVTNRSTDPASLLAVCLEVGGAGFTLSPERLELGPGQSATVTVGFAPDAEGHAAGTVALVSGASNRPLILMIARGYGGTAPGSGPTLASAPAFYLPRLSDGVRAALPSGENVAIGTPSSTCSGGSSFGDACTGDTDCSENGGTCPRNATCLDGDRSGQTCAVSSDCPTTVQDPTGVCPATVRSAGCGAATLDVTQMCGDGAGGLYVLSEDTFTDPEPPADDYPKAGTLFRFQTDAAGNSTGAVVLSRPTEDTTLLACDRFAAEAGGRVYLAETRSTPESSDCFRDTRESLVGIRKSNGDSVVVMPRIDAAAGVTECDDIDNASHLEVSADGAQAFASFDSNGLWRLRPSPLQFVDSSFFVESFRLHPDGSVIFATVSDATTVATVRLFKVTPAQVASGPLPVDGLPPCATFQVPNNRVRSAARSQVTGLGVSPPTPDSRDATILVSVITSRLVEENERCFEINRRGDNLTVRGTIAFSSPADSTACTPIGLVNLEAMTDLTF